MGRGGLRALIVEMWTLHSKVEADEDELEEAGFMQD